jgi:hypothetical protein
LIAAARKPAGRKQSSKGNNTMKSHFSIREVAWLLNVSESRVCWAIRVGALRTSRRRSQLVITAAELRRMLDGGAR